MHEELPQLVRKLQLLSEVSFFLTLSSCYVQHEQVIFDGVIDDDYLWKKK